MVSEKAVKIVTEFMKVLNNRAADVIKDVGANAITDVTGFGLLGHLYEIINGEEIGARIYCERVPFFPEVEQLSKMGLVPAGTHNNINARKFAVINDADIESYFLDILFDAQTSGGLLFTVPERHSFEVINKLNSNGVKHTAIIGEIVAEPKGKILLQ